LPRRSLAATVSAATCARADVATAITNAADGDTVRIPAGSCSWGSGISTSKGITILGAGQGSTIITSGGFDMSTPSGKSFRISGFTLRGTSVSRCTVNRRLSASTTSRSTT
jgi:hypothetical protein